LYAKFAQQSAHSFLDLVSDLANFGDRFAGGVDQRVSEPPERKPPRDRPLGVPRRR
jgi:hypothetical protein